MLANKEQVIVLGDFNSISASDKEMMKNKQIQKQVVQKLGDNIGWENVEIDSIYETLSNLKNNGKENSI